MHSRALTGCGKAASPDAEGLALQAQSHAVFPSQLHDYRTEQPETFWLERAPQLPVREGRVRGAGEAALPRRGAGQAPPHSGTPPGCQQHQDPRHAVPEELQFLNARASVAGAAVAL